MFLDTNVLVRARFEAAPCHAIARHLMQAVGESREPLRINRQVAREYLATVTRPQRWSPPIGMDEALDHVNALEERFEILEDGPLVAAMLKRLCSEFRVAGKQVHDANIAATMLAYGERRLLTFNGKDFRRYGTLLELLEGEELQ